MANANRMWCCSACALLLVSFSMDGIAQIEEGSGTGQLREIVVTAQKREENVQKVPASVTVINDAELVARGVVDLRGIASFLPMIELNMEDATTQIFIRGIGQTSDADTNSPAVAANVDGIYTPRFALSQSLFDVDRVEVLSGPQGTLYGRNAAGGAVNVTTKVPAGHFESDGYLEVGNYSTIHVF